MTRCHTILLLILALLTGLVCPVPAQSERPQITPFQVETFAGQCPQLLQRERFAELSSLYHAPAELSAQQREAEQRQLSDSLRRLVALFGTPSVPVLLDAPLKAHQLAVQGLDQAYWQDHDRYYPASYRVHFAGEGAGILSFQVVVYGNRLQLRSIIFGLPESRPGSAERIKELAARM